MHIKVNDILAQDVGYQKSFEIADEAPELDGLQLAEDLNGNISISRLDDSLLARGQVATSIELECHRCLRAFQYPVQVNLSGEFSFKPPADADDQWPITKDYSIDVAPLIRQELLLRIPLKQLCEPDCPGLCPDCGLRLDDQHKPH
jgi:uncharacterized protein